MSTPFDFSGVWRTRYFLADITARVSQAGDRVWGVVEVVGPLGGKDLYHVRGRVSGPQVVAWHHNGRQFRGRATALDKAEGVLTVKSGDTLNIRAVRQSRGQAGGEKPL
ncbi:MAG: hypothetical protein ACEB74_10125 [Desulfovibrio aminophilus]|uniref:hypothetical protein n=1 Tax=Desulfovibrio aminophilus TaxID=81425 RepID=UPI0039E8E34F